MKWNLISDKPTQSKRVMVAIKGRPCPHLCIYDKDNNVYTELYSSDIIEENITHWANIPIMPKI